MSIEAIAPEAYDATTMAHYLDSLNKCEGWTKWLLPWIQQQAAEAQNNILTAIREGNTPEAADTSKYRGVQPILELIDQHKKRTIAVISSVAAKTVVPPPPPS